MTQSLLRHLRGLGPLSLALGFSAALGCGTELGEALPSTWMPISCIRDPSSSVTVEVPHCHYYVVNGQDFYSCEPSTFEDVPCSDPQFEKSGFFERTNCQGSNNGPDADWETVRRCPVGKVATSLTLHERDGGGNRDMFDGLRMVCNPVD